MVTDALASFACVFFLPLKKKKIVPYFLQPVGGQIIILDFSIFFWLMSKISLVYVLMKLVTSGTLSPEAVKSPNVHVVPLHMTNIMIKSLKSEMDCEICFTKNENKLSICS